MKIQVPNRGTRMAVLLFSCALAVVLSYLGARNAWAAHYLGMDTRAGYERAVRLEPGNSRNWYLLGRSYLYDLEQPDPARAVESLGKAVALDPYSSEALLDLAIAYDGEGETGQARSAFLAALRVYPQSADVCWSYGNFLLRQGDQDTAFGEIRKAVELDPKRAAEAFSRALGVQPDAGVLLDKAVPPTARVYLPILRALSESGDMDRAQLVWNRFIALREQVQIADATPFVGALIKQRRPGDASEAWKELVSVMRNPPPPDTEGSLLWDGGFESGYAGGGFGWHFIPETKDVQISFDRTEKHSGQQSLRILFKGRRNLSFEDGCHNITPEPGKQYLLTGWVRTESLTSSQGVRLQIFAYSNSKDEAVTTEELHGTQEWRQIQLSWTAPPGASFGSVCVKRLMSDMPGSDIQGAAWIDDLSLVPVDEASPKR
jgi:hypothetical protein